MGPRCQDPIDSGEMDHIRHAHANLITGYTYG